MIVKFTKTFSDCPAGREHAAQLRKEVLHPLIGATPLLPDQKLVIDLDGGPGYAASFLEELFGGFVRQYGCGLLVLIDLGIVSFISNDEPQLIDEIRDFVVDAEREREAA